MPTYQLIKASALGVPNIIIFTSVGLVTSQMLNTMDKNAEKETQMMEL
jgi:hypothetical protein